MSVAMVGSYVGGYAIMSVAMVGSFVGGYGIMSVAMVGSFVGGLWDYECCDGRTFRRGLWDYECCGGRIFSKIHYKGERRLGVEVRRRGPEGGIFDFGNPMLVHETTRWSPQLHGPEPMGLSLPFLLVFIFMAMHDGWKCV
jgi:hypothetical protein